MMTGGLIGNRQGTPACSAFAQFVPITEDRTKPMKIFPLYLLWFNVF